MTNQDWLYRVSGPLIAASNAAGLNDTDKKIANGYAWLVAKHKQLDLMPVSDAKQQYELLDSNVQEALKSNFSDASYLQDDPSLLSKIWDVATAPVETAWNALGSYGEALSTPFRMIMTGQSWDASFDGKKIFDKNLEKQTDAAYSAEVVKIAKAVATGKGFGEVLGTLTTDAEFEAFSKYAAGDQTILNAIRDYDNAKISWGRSFARMLGLSPDIGKTEQGVEGTAYKFLSGTADLAGDIIFDPLTFVAAPIKAIQGARFGLMSLIRSEAGALSFVDKMRQARGLSTGFDAAFELPRVRKAYDTVGPMLQRFNDAPSELRGGIAEQIQRVQPDMDLNTIQQLSRAGVKDADSALQFFKNTDTVTNIMMGKVGEMQGKLATHTILTDGRNALRNSVRDLLGQPHGGIPTTELNDAIKATIDTGTELHNVLRAKKIRNIGDRTLRVFERALATRTVHVGGLDEAGRSLNIKSSGTIYSLARIFLPKYESRVLANTYASLTDEAASRNMLRGLLDSLAEHFGIESQGLARQKYDDLVRKWSSPMYSEKQNIDAELAAKLNLKEGPYDPSFVDGRSQAVANNQLSNMVSIPDIRKIAELGQKNMLLKAAGKSVEGAWISGATDFWSALNLLPRLGIRSVLDESLMQGLVMPLPVIANMIKGYQAGISERIITGSKSRSAISLKNPGQVKDVGFGARMLRPFLYNITDAERALAGKGDAETAVVLGGLLQRSAMSKITRINETDIKYFQDATRYGHSDDIRSFGEGLTESTTSGLVTDMPSSMAGRYNLNTQELAKDLGVKFGSIPTLITKGNSAHGSPDYIVNFFKQLNDRVDRNGFVGQLAVQYMKNPEKAVQKIAEHLRTDGAKWYSRFDRSRLERAGQRSVEQDATDMYLHVRKLFYSDEGQFNDVLWKKLKVGGTIDSRSLTIEDYYEFADNLPSQLMGYAEKRFAHEDFPKLLSDTVNKGFSVSDRQIGTLTREPTHKAYYLYYRRKLQPVQDKEMARLKALGFSEEVALDVTSRKFSQLASDNAMQRLIGFVDNPNVRSVLALQARNVARYYRANEDFARRAVRVLKDPKALVRLRIGMEGLDHSGFIHEDDNGEKYFSMPVDEIMYPVYSNFIQFFGGDKPRQMMPLDLTGKIKMLTPSADPESWTPTFAGPFISIAINTTATMFKNLGYTDLSEGLNRALLGKYADSSASFLQLISPTVLKRAYEGISATNQSDPNAISEQVISAFFKSAAFYTANGMAPGADATLSERDQFKRDITATARNVVAIRNLLGIWSPVAPSLSETVDVPDYLLENDTTSWRSEFRSLVEAEVNNGTPMPYDEALRKWTKLFPGRLVYTVPETELETVAPVKKTRAAVAWIKKNDALVKQHRQGSTFLMPQMNSYDIDAYAFLKREGYIKSKTLDQYLEDIANVNAENEYFDMRDRFAKAVADAPTVEGARSLNAGYEQQLQQFKDERPYLRLALEHNSTGNQLKLDVLKDTRDMLASALAPKNATAGILNKMIREYDAFKAQFDSVSSQSDSDAAFRNKLRIEASNKIVEIAGINPNAQAFYKTILKRLIEG